MLLRGHLSLIDTSTFSSKYSIPFVHNKKALMAPLSAKMGLSEELKWALDVRSGHHQNTTLKCK